MKFFKIQLALSTCAILAVTALNSRFLLQNNELAEQDPLQTLMVHAFGVDGAQDIYKMAFEGATKPAVMEWEHHSYYGKFRIRYPALKSFCQSLVPTFPIVLDSDLGYLNYVLGKNLQKFLNDYGNQFYNCKIEYHISLRNGIIHNLPVLPYVSLDWSFAPLNALKALLASDKKFEKVRRIALYNVEYDASEWVNIVHSAKSDVESSQFWLRGESKNFDMFPKYLESTNKIKELHLSTSEYWDRFSKDQVEALKNAFSHKNFNVKELSLLMAESNIFLVDLVEAASKKVDKLQVKLNENVPLRDFFSIFYETQSVVTGLSLKISVGLLLDKRKEQILELTSLLTYPSNKIKYLRVDEFIPISNLVTILSSANNKLETLIIDSSEYNFGSDEKEEELIKALTNPNCKLKFLGLQLYKHSFIEKMRRIEKENGIAMDLDASPRE